MGKRGEKYNKIGESDYDKYAAEFEWNFKVFSLASNERIQPLKFLTSWFRGWRWNWRRFRE